MATVQEKKVTRDMLRNMRTNSGTTFLLESFAACLNARTIAWQLSHMDDTHVYKTSIDSDKKSITIIKLKRK